MTNQIPLTTTRPLEESQLREEIKRDRMAYDAILSKDVVKR
jgi:hypothetical protein